MHTYVAAVLAAWLANAEALHDITTVITTYPHRGIPSTELIERTLDSLKHVELHLQPVIIAFDGAHVQPSAGWLDPKCNFSTNGGFYDEYKQRVKQVAISIMS